VPGGPGTGKTVVALHRAAYLLYTNRFPLEDQGVLVIGPNRVFLRYIERVLPSLGEAGIEQVVLQDLVPGVNWVTSTQGLPDSPLAARLKGDERMSDVIDKAVRDRERPLRDDIEVPFRHGYVRLKADETERIIKAARRRFRRHNAGRKWVEGEVYDAMARSWRGESASGRDVREAVRQLDDVRNAFERMWPLLTPAQFLHDLLGSRALIRSAASKYFSDAECDALHRPRSASLDEVRFTVADAALLDEAFVRLGPLPQKNGKIDEADDIRTYGHIVVDEVQDLTPMQLAMVTRRSLSGSMTVVGDLAQATGPHAPSSWDDVLDHLPETKHTRVIGLSVGYRIPGQIMDLANRVMAAAAPGLRAPTAVRIGDAPPEFVRAQSSPGSLSAAVVEAARSLVDKVSGNIAVVVPDALADDCATWFERAGVRFGRATATALEQGVTIVPVSVVKGLELDGVIVVEPSRIVEQEAQGLRLLYVALTRATQRLTVVHSGDLPASLSGN